MANVNVNRNVDDAFYRYKMPRIIAKVEGKGNGIKTVIVNMPEVAKALARPPTYPTKYFGCELGAQTQFDAKNDRFIVNGQHDSIRLQDLLDGFIKRFVLCQECDNPETNLNVLQKKGMIQQICIACGHRANVDMRHKLTTFILKNPPDQDPAAPTPKKDGKKSRSKKGSRSETVNGDADGHENGTEGKSKKRSSTGEDEDDVDWGEDTSEAAVQQRMGELSSAAKNMTISDDVEKSQQQRVDLFYAYIKERKESGQLSGSERIKDALAEAERLDVKDKAPMVLVELLYDTNILTQIPKYRALFLRFTRGNAKAQRYLLGGFEQLVGVVYKEVLLPKVPHILKAFYEGDILEEETLLDWDKKASKKYVSKELSKEIHAKAAPFVNWLKEAEEETSEDEEEEGVEVVYSHTERVGTQTIPKEAPADKIEEDYDFDINDI